MNEHHPDAARSRPGNRLKAMATSPVLLVSAVFSLLIVLVLSGALDRLAAPAELNRPRALMSSLLYWLLSLLVVLVVTRWKTRKKVILIAAGSAVAVLLGAELWFRTYIPAPSTLGFKFIHSERYHHGHPPSHRLFILHDDEGKPIFATTNEDGLRSTYSREQFLRFGKRVAVLGDSFTFGFKVDQEAAFPQVLERTLRARLGTPDLGVLNAGITTYSPYVEHLLFEGVVAAYRPDLVLLVVDATDIADDAAFSRVARTRGTTTSFGTSSVWRPSGESPGDYSALYQRLQPLGNAVQGLLLQPFASATTISTVFGEPTRITIDGVEERNKWFIYRHPLDKTRPYFDATLKHITDTASAAERIGAKFVLVIAPRFQHWNPRECPDNREKGEYTLNEPFQNEYLRFFDEAKSSSAFPIVGLIDALRATKEFPLVFRDDPHWNRRGHAVVADALAEVILERQWISRNPEDPR